MKSDENSGRSRGPVLRLVRLLFSSVQLLIEGLAAFGILTFVVANFNTHAFKE